jgi:hypothetical protein
MSGISLGYVPYLRPGSLVFTAVVLQFLAAGRIGAGKAIRDVYGDLRVGSRNLFGNRARYISNTVFSDSLSPLDVLQRHSLFGIYSRGLPQSSADKWAKTLMDGGPRGALRAGTSGGGPTFSYSTTDLRSCRTCVLQDMDEFGFPSWYVLHTIPAVHHCPYHGTALHIEANGKDGGMNRKLHLPAQPSIDILPERICAISDGYAAYLGLWVELFRGRQPVVAPHAWARHMDSIVDRYGSVKSAVGELSRQITQSWDVRPAGLRSMLGNHIQHNFIRNELTHRTASSWIAQKLVMLTACDALLIRPLEQNSAEQMSLVLGSGKLPDSQPQHEQVLRGELLSAGCPLAALPALMSGESFSGVASTSGVGLLRIRRVIATWPKELLDEMNAIKRWPERSWLTRELLRRNGTRYKY